MPPCPSILKTMTIQLFMSGNPLWAIFGRDLIFQYFALFRDIPKKILITRGPKNQIDVLDK